MSLSKLQTAYKKRIKKSTSKGKKVANKKVVTLKELSRNKDAIKLYKNHKHIDFR